MKTRIHVEWEVKFRAAMVTLGTVKGSADCPVKLFPGLVRVFQEMAKAGDAELFRIDVRGVKIAAKVVSK